MIVNNVPFGFETNILQQVQGISDETRPGRLQEVSPSSQSVPF